MAKSRKTDRRSIRRRATLDEPVLVDQFHANRRGETVRIELKTYEGKNLVDVRKFFTGKEGLPIPSTKGICISVLRIPEMLKALTAAHRKALDLGLLEPEA